jgi:Chaperone of endosialidase
MNKYRILASMLFTVSAVFAQDVKVNGNSGASEVFLSTNTNTTAIDRIGVSGRSTPAPYFGIGVKGSGGYIGVLGEASLTGGGNRTGGSFSGSGSSTNRGVSADGSGPAGSTNYGLYATSWGGTNNYGVYGYAWGGTNNYGVYCAGNGVYTGSWTKLSDARTKKNIQNFTGALAKVMTVGVKKYDFDQAAFPSMNLKSKSEVGVIAQDIEKIFPDLVETIVAPDNSVTGKDSKPQSNVLKGVDYIALVPILLQAIQEQQAQIEALKKKVGG